MWFSDCNWICLFAKCTSSMILALSMLGNFSCFCCHLLTFSKLVVVFFFKLFHDYHQSFCLFDLILYVPVNNPSVMSGRVFLGWTSTKQGSMCLAQGHNAVRPVRLEPTVLWSRVKHSIIEPLRFLKWVRVSTSLDPDQARHSVGPDLDPKGLQKLLLARQKAPNLDF